MKKITLLLFLFALQSQAQTYYSENFEGGTLNGWISTDSDLDGHEWAVLNASSIDATLGTGSMVSFSYDDATSAPLSPDNLVTSPAIDLTTVSASNVYFLYDQSTAADWPDEHYAIYITTSNDPSVIAASIVNKAKSELSDLFETLKCPLIVLSLSSIVLRNC